MGKFQRLVIGSVLTLVSSTAFAAVIESTSLVGFGTAKYPDNFTHFDYVEILFYRLNALYQDESLFLDVALHYYKK